MGVRTCIFLCCFVFFTLWEQNCGVFSRKFFSCVLFLQPLCVSVWTCCFFPTPDFSRAAPECAFLSLPGPYSTNPSCARVPQPDGFLCLCWNFQAVEDPVEASSRGGTAVCDGEEILPFPHYMVVSCYPPQCWGASCISKAVVHQGQSLAQPWAPLCGCCQPFPAALVSPTGLGWRPSPCSGPLRAQSGGTSSALPRPCGKWHRK